MTKVTDAIFLLMALDTDAALCRATQRDLAKALRYNPSDAHIQRLLIRSLQKQYAYILHEFQRREE